MSTPGLHGLGPWARSLGATAYGVWLRESPADFGVNHWLVALDQVGFPPEFGSVAKKRGRQIRAAQEAIARGEAGPLLDIPALARRAEGRRGDFGESISGSILGTIFEAAGDREARFIGAADTARSEPGADDEVTDAEGASTHSPRPRRVRPTKRQGLLDQFGSDLTQAARDGKLAPVLGRELEVQQVVETLCRRTKRNPALLGPAGVGKTAIAEALAQRIVSGEVPPLLRDKPLIALPASSLVAGTGIVGALEDRMEKILAEAIERNAILFFDELHTLVGAGSSGSHPSGGVSNMLKPSLARGDIACIAATTDDEYRRYIEPDSALERRFQPIRIQETNLVQTTTILESLCERYLDTQGVGVETGVVSWLIDFAGRYMHNRFFPDKGIDLLEQCFAHAVATEQAMVTRAIAEKVAQRVVGMPLDLDQRLAALRHSLVDRALLVETDVNDLVSRLSVTLRGLDLRPSRPNAVLLLLGDAASVSDSIATTIATELFGSAERKLIIDLSSYVEPHSVSMLVGSGPGYVGYQDTLPLHRLAQTPWCVLCLEHIDACHPAVRELIRQGLNDGYLTMGDSKRLYISDCVVQMTATVSADDMRSLGFRHGGDNRSGAEHVKSVAAGSLGEAIFDQADVVASHGPQTSDQRRRWLNEHLLPQLQRRYHERRLNLAWDDGVLDWLVNKGGADDLRGWERLIENQIAPLLIPHLPQAGEAERNLRLAIAESGSPEVEPA